MSTNDPISAPVCRPFGRSRLSEADTSGACPRTRPAKTRAYLASDRVRSRRTRVRSAFADAVAVLARRLEVRGELLERRMREEDAHALAHLALEHVGVAVAVRAERRRAVVDVQRAQAVEADRRVDLARRPRRARRGRSRRSPRRRGGTSRGRCRAARAARARRRASPARSIERPIVPPVPAEFSISSHVSPLQRLRTFFIAAHDPLQRGVEPAAEVRADVEDDRRRPRSRPPCRPSRTSP